MAAKWPTVVLREHYDLLVGFAFKSEGFRAAPPGVRIARGDNVTEGQFRWGEKTRYWPEVSDDLRRYLLQPGDVLIGMDGSKVGRNWTRVRESDLPCLLVQRVACLRAKASLDQGYLTLLISSDLFKNYVDAVKTGSSIPHISGRQIGDFSFPLPPIDEQRAIAHILGTLDDKIELNRRMNETLEEMARALFKSWFVDFDPVRRKAEGRDPGLPKHLADLFPSRFVYSELGEIPEGWSTDSVYGIADVIYGAPFASSQFNTRAEGRPLIRIRDLADESPEVWTPEVHPKGHLLCPGDIVVSMDGEFRAYLWGGIEGWVNQRVCTFVPKPGFTAAFVRNSLLEPLATVESTETATTVIHLGKNDIDRFRVVQPTRKILEAFGQLAQTWYSRIVRTKQETRTLAALRDTLLPRLISGELRIDDADDFLAGVPA